METRAGLEDRPPTFSTKGAFEDYVRAWLMPDIQKFEQEQGTGIDRTLRRDLWEADIEHKIRTGQLPERASRWVVPAWVLGGATP